MQFRRLHSVIEDLQSSEISRQSCYCHVIPGVISALEEWGQLATNNPMLKTLLGMKNLMREIEESIEPLAFISNLLSGNDQDIQIVDLCSGKGVFSMLARHTAFKIAGMQKVRKIIMIDKQTKGRINLSHLEENTQSNLPSIEFHDIDIHSKQFMEVRPLLLPHCGNARGWYPL